MIVTAFPSKCPTVFVTKDGVTRTESGGYIVKPDETSFFLDVHHPGMTLRAYLAAQAIAGVDCVSCPNSLESIAIHAVALADAVIHELQKAKEPNQ